VFGKTLKHDATGAQIYSFKAFKNLQNDAANKAKNGLISEAQWKQYSSDLLTNEEEIYHSDVIFVDRYI
jgi:hypothetical protein